MPATRTPVGPTLTEIRSWPAAVNVEDYARAFGISRAYAYESIRQGGCPVRTVKVGGRIKVLTHSIIEVLEPPAAA
ncbi:DNA-binding protein [Glycomyces sp. NPDC047369]